VDDPPGGFEIDPAGEVVTPESDQRNTQAGPAEVTMLHETLPYDRRQKGRARRANSYPPSPGGSSRMNAD